MKFSAAIACGMTAALAATAMSAASANAQTSASKTFVMAAFGGVNQTALDQACLDPFAAAHGLTPEDTTNSSLAELEVQEKSHDVTWNVDLDALPGPYGNWGSVVQPINYKIVGRTSIPKAYQWKYATGVSTVTAVIVYNATAYGGKAPKTWSDFFNLKKFPGQREMPSVAYNGAYAISEAAEMAYQNASQPHYPIIKKDVFAEMDKIKSHVTLYTSTTQAEEAIVSGQADMVMLSANHALPAIASLPSGSPTWKVQWNQNLVETNQFEVPKGAPDTKLDMEFIHYCLETGPQVTYATLVADGPVNPAAAAALPQSLKATEPAGHSKDASPINQDYWSPSVSAKWATWWESWQISS